MEPAKTKTRGKGWLTMTAAGELVGVAGQAVRGWAKVGVIGRDRERIRLQVRVIGGRYFTRRKWLREYLRLVTEARNPDPDGGRAAVPESPAARQKRFAKSKQAALDRLDGRRR